jgi:hypothetical protein
VRLVASACVNEIAAYLAIAAALLVRPNRRPSAACLRLWTVFAALAAVMFARAFYLRLFRGTDLESPFSRARDALGPLLLVLTLWSRVRFSERQQRRIGSAIVVVGVVLGAVGILQFFQGAPYLFDGIENTQWKTRYAKNYFIAQLFHLDVQQIARGFNYFSIEYAMTLVAPCLVAFSLAWRGRGWRRLAALLAFGVVYAGMYFSFSRSVLAVMPFACGLAALVMAGKLRPWMCVAGVAAYLAAAFVAPLLHVSLLGDDDLGTLNARLESLKGYLREVGRDGSILLVGGTVASWKEWESVVPHNWIVNSLLTDGAPATALRLGSYVAMFGALFPSSRRGRVTPLAAGLWCGAFTLLAVIGETEPLAGISAYLGAGFALSVLATST